MQGDSFQKDGSRSSLEAPLRASSDQATSQSLPSSAQIKANTQLLRLETITDTESRRIVLFMKVTVCLALVGAIIVASIKESSRGAELIVLNRNFVIVQVVLFGILLGSLLLMFAVWGAAIASSFHNQMVWSLRRRRAVQATLVRGCVATMILTGQFAINVKLLTDPSTYCFSKTFMPAVGFLVFTGFNSILLLLVVDAHGTNFTEGKTHTIVRDAPWTSHWPKVAFIWLPFLGLVIWTVAMIAEDGHSVEVAVVDGGECGWGAEVVCGTSVAFNTAGGLSVLAICVYFVLYGVYLVRAWRQLATKLYQKYRMQNIVLRMQVRVNAAMVATMLVSMGLTWYLGNDTCVNYAVTWFGVSSVSLMVVSIQAMSFYVTYPRSRRAIASYQAAPTYMLQQFAWTEPDVPRKLAARAEATAGNDSVHAMVAAAPLFCFETAIKLFFWSVLVYSYTETDPSDIQNVPGAIRKLIGDMEGAMAMFGLAKRRMFYDRSCGTKVLVTWNASTILVVVRGSVEVANYLQDAKFLQTAHPPARKFRGRTPSVHQGFLATWQSNSIHRRVLAHIAALLDSAEDRAAVRVLCTGHSLGGAVAQLASFDIVRELGVPPRQVSVYTYGCPRFGNHALAEEFDEAVPDTWHIINDNDVVTRSMKLFGLYKRAGQRVIVNREGHLIVRPSHLETSLLQRIRGGRSSQHLTVEYQRCLVAIVTAQLQAASRHDDGLHGLLGLLKGVPQVRLALETHAQSMGTSLPDLMRGIRPDLPDNQRSLGAPHFSSRHHKSLVRAAGGLVPDDAAAAREARGSAPGSPASSGSADVPTVFVDTGVAGDVEASAAAVADAANSGPVQDAVAGAAALGLSRWRSATAVARLVVGLARNTAAAATAASPRSPNRRSGSTAETGASEDALQGPDAVVKCTLGGGDGSKGPNASWLSPRAGEAQMHGEVLEMGAAPDMRGLHGGHAAVAAQLGEGGERQVDVYDTAGSRTIELVDAAAKVDIEVAEVDSHGVAEGRCDDDSGSCSSSGYGGLQDGSAHVLHEVKELGKTDSVGKTDSMGRGVSPITNSEGGSTLSATGGGMSLSPVAPMGGAVIVEEGGLGARDGGAAEVDEGGGACGMYGRSIDNQLFLSDTRSSFISQRGPGASPKPISPPGKGIGRRGGAGQVRLVDTDAVVLQMGGSSDGRAAAAPVSFGSAGPPTATSSCHQELSLMDADPLSNNASLAACLPPRPSSGSAAVGGLPTAPGYLLGRSPGRDGAGGDVRGQLPCPLSLGRASDDDSMHLTTASAWSDGAGHAASDGGDDDGVGRQYIGGIGPHGLPVLGWNQIPNQEPERVRGAKAR